MPLYDFQCQSCDHVFERICTYDDKEVQVCPKCLSDQTIRLIATPHLVKSGVLFARSKVPSEFKSGVLDRIKKHYKSSSDSIKT